MNPNLFIWVSDWHIGRRPLDQMQAVAQHVVSLAPAGVIDTGDCKEHPGVGSGPELDQYVTHVRNVLPWALVYGATAEVPILPGNHDEIPDYADAAPTDFSLFNARLWGPPYHWATNWEAPQIRFLATHTELVRPPSNLAGFARVSASEIQWLSDELNALPEGWQAIVCSHFPANVAFGNQIRGDLGGTDLLAVLSAHKTRIAAYLNGHRHSNMNTSVLDGIRHFNGPGVSYTQGNGHGGFVPIDYNEQARTLTFRFLLGTPPFAAFPGYTPVVLQLPPLEESGLTPAQLLDLAVGELKLTTVGYLNPYWVDPPIDTHWRQALTYLDQVA